MNAGRLRHKIQIQQFSTVVSNLGELTKTWTTVHDVRSDVNPIRGREYFQEGRIHSQTTHKIRLRYIAGISSAMRIVFGSRIFEIESVINVEERNREIEIMAKETT